MKIKYVSLCLGLIEIGFGNVFAASQSQSLSESVGATDVYKLNCDSLAGQSTAYASLQIKDDTIGQSASAPQLININLSKKGLAPINKKIIEANSGQLVLNGGNGNYTVKIDTIGSNIQYKSQNYQIQYQCFYDTNTVTTASASGLRAGTFVTKTINTGKNTSYSINCSQKSITSTVVVNNKKKKIVTKYDTKYIQVDINNITSNITNNQAYLNAQLSRIDIGRAINASDRFGDTEYGGTVSLTPIDTAGASVGNGDYYISIDTTANASTATKAKNYTFQYGCYSANGQLTSANLSQIQDQ